MLTLRDFPNVTHYAKSLTSRVHVNIADLLINTCTLVATYVILRRLECTHAKILVSALEHQVSRGDSHDEVVNYWSNLAYASK